MEDINNLCQIKQFCVKSLKKMEGETGGERDKQMNKGKLAGGA